MRELQQKRMYGNCVMLSPAGEILCLCDRKKINWYLSRNLATLIKEDPPTIQLSFVPKGNGKADYPYYTSEKKNRCVCCASVDRLTKHHCVPRCFRRNFPKAYKSHNCHDIVLLCDKCHMKYETSAMQLKNDLVKQYQVELYARNGEDLDLRQAASDANALLKYADRIPLPRQQELSQRLRDYLKKDFNNEDLENLLKQDSKLNRLVSEADRFGARIVGQLPDIPEFIRMWRRHFVSTMNPQYLPKFWDVEHDDLLYEEKS